VRPSEYDAHKVGQASDKGQPVARLARPGVIIAVNKVNHLVVTMSTGGLEMTSFDPNGNRIASSKVGKVTLTQLESAIFGSQVQTARIVLPDDATATALIAAAAGTHGRLAQAVAMSMRLPIAFHVTVVPRALDRKYYAPRGTDTTTLEGWAGAFGVKAANLPQLTMNLFKNAVKHRWFDGYFNDGDLSAYDYEFEALKYLTGPRSLTGDILGMRNATNLNTWWTAATRFDLIGRRRAATDGSVMRVEAVGPGSFVALGPITTRVDKSLVPLPVDQPSDLRRLGSAYTLNVSRVEADTAGEITIVGFVRGSGSVSEGKEYMLTEAPYFSRGGQVDKKRNKWLAGVDSGLTPKWRDVPEAVSLAGAPPAS